MNNVSLQKNGVFWLVAILGILLDQITKLWAVQVLQPQFEIQLWPEVFHLTYVENRGAAWSLFENAGGFLRWVSLGVAVALILVGILNRLTRWEQWGYGFVLAGAVGNGIDRFVQGYVVDLFNVTLIDFPVFNVADIAINVGVGCLVIASLRRGKPSANRGDPISGKDALKALPDGTASGDSSAPPSS